MILAYIWTGLAFIGLLGSIRNIRNRNANARAIVAKGINGPALLTAKSFRNSEVIRLGQAVIGFLVGVTAIIFYQSQYYKAVNAAASAGQLPQPSIVYFYRAAIQWAFFLWNLLLVVNIWYFGLIGDRAARLRRRTHDSRSGEEGFKATG